MIINTNSITPDEAVQTIIDLWDLKCAFMIWGPPGVGKSAVPAEIAKRLEARLYDTRLGTKIASDIGGLPYPDIEGGLTRYLRPEFLPLPDPTSPDRKQILFLDELTTADEQTRTAAYGLILERRVGEYTLPEHCRIIAASNREEDGAVSANLGSALYDRMIHLVIEPEPESWLRWAVEQQIHPAVLGFLKTQPNFLSATQDELNGEDALLPTPRSWERISNILHATGGKKITKTARIAIEGTIGISRAATFFALAEQVVQLPSIDTLLKERDPYALGKHLPQTVEVLYALGYALASALSLERLNDIFRVINHIAEMPATTGGPDVAVVAGALCCERAYRFGDGAAKMCYEMERSPEFKRYDARVRGASGDPVALSVAA